MTCKMKDQYRFFDLIEVDIAERSLRVCAAAGIKRYGPDLAHIRSERERLLREQAENENEDMQFERAMEYACQMMQRRISTTAKENAIVEEKVATAEGSMTNRIMLTEFHKSHDVATKLVSNDNTGVHEPEKKAQDIWKEDLKRAAIQERKSRENGAQTLRCNREELKMLALKERRNRESIAESIKHQSTPQVDSEANSREELKRRALEERRMRERDKRNLAGVPLMRARHQHRGNEKKANVGEARAKDSSVSNSDSKEAALQHNKIDDHNRRWQEKQHQKPAQGENKQQLDREVAWNKTDARATSTQADDDAAIEKAATLDDVKSPDIGVGGEHIDTDELAAPMRELPEKLVEQINTNRAAASMRELSERLVGNYEIVATEKDAEKLLLKELQQWPENLWRRLAETEAALNAERMAHAETRQKLKELIVAKVDGVSPKDVSQSPVIEVGGERDTSIISSAAASMTEFREVKSTADDLRVELEAKSQLDKDVSQSPVIEVGGE